MKVCQVEGMMFPPVAEMPEKCARWEVRCFHLSRKCGESVPGGRYNAAPENQRRILWENFVKFACRPFSSESYLTGNKCIVNYK